MGCVSSKAAQRTALEQQLRTQIAKVARLLMENEDLKEVLGRVCEERKDRGKTEQWKEKVRELEEKIAKLEEMLREQEESEEDLFSRGSQPDSPPDILLDTAQLESAPPSEARSSRSILDDPLIRELYERKRQMFILKKCKDQVVEAESQPQISPTMTSTHVSNKAV